MRSFTGGSPVLGVVQLQNVSAKQSNENNSHQYSQVLVHCQTHKLKWESLGCGENRAALLRTPKFCQCRPVATTESDHTQSIQFQSDEVMTILDAVLI